MTARGHEWIDKSFNAQISDGDHERCQGCDDEQRIAIIETAERRVRAMCPDAYRGGE